MDVIIGLGANLGDRLQTMQRAVNLVQGLPDTHVVAVSAVYDTEPLGPPQPRYLNAALRVQPRCSLRDLLHELLAIEMKLGRVRGVPMGPRSIDLDILWASEVAEQKGLHVPHPELRKRAFALAPLMDVAPELRPVYGSDLEQLGLPLPSKERLVLSRVRVL